MDSLQQCMPIQQYKGLHLYIFHLYEQTYAIMLKINSQINSFHKQNNSDYLCMSDLSGMSGTTQNLCHIVGANIKFGMQHHKQNQQTSYFVDFFYQFGSLFANSTGKPGMGASLIPRLELYATVYQYYQLFGCLNLYKVFQLNYKERNLTC